VFPSVFYLLKPNCLAVGARFDFICVIRVIRGQVFCFFGSPFVASAVQILRDYLQKTSGNREAKEFQNNFKKDA